MRLTDDELRDVLARAEEIQRASGYEAEMRAVIGAGEEVGLARSAVERALRERVNLLMTPDVGGLVFAKSADEKFYVAEVLSVSDSEVRVRFLRGSEHLVARDEIRPCSFIPGERVVCNWPWWGQWTCTVVSYDSDKKRVKLSDGSGGTKTFPVAEVWLAAPRKTDGDSSRRRMYLALAGGGAVLGGIIGSILTALLVR